ncbi:protein kinase [Streptomyces sp. NPDC006259]|uniref:protein kinase domain-containing protein n=1 Tax=Streptomyces sp. NPDC006259 TaxID=3364740 RepID=UPI0036B1E208
MSNDGPPGGANGRTVGGRYQLLARIGSGGMGTVWRARDLLMQREVAVKEPRLPGDPEDESHRRAAHRLYREARAAARVEHPSAVSIHDVVVEEGEGLRDGLPWIVMELVRGESLHEVLRRGPLDPAEAARIGLAVLGALRAAHAVGIVHRDVKPANVLLGPHDRVVLTDFGIAQIQGEESLTAGGEFVGSLEFVAPERMSGRGAGPASDLWSLGVLLYAAVEGWSPFRRTTVESTLAAILAADLPEPEQAGPLAPLLIGLLARDPERRPDPAEAATALEAVTRGGWPAPSTATEPAEPQDAGRLREFGEDVGTVRVGAEVEAGAEAGPRSTEPPGYPTPPQGRPTPPQAKPTPPQAMPQSSQDEPAHSRPEPERSAEGPRKPAPDPSPGTTFHPVSRPAPHPVPGPEPDPASRTTSAPASGPAPDPASGPAPDPVPGPAPASHPAPDRTPLLRRPAVLTLLTVLLLAGVGTAAPLLLDADSGAATERPSTRGGSSPISSTPSTLPSTTSATTSPPVAWTAHRESRMGAVLSLPAEYRESARQGGADEQPRLVVYSAGSVDVRLTQWDRAPGSPLGRAAEAHQTWDGYDGDARTQTTRTTFQGHEAVLADTTYGPAASPTRVMELFVLAEDSRMYELRVDMPKGTPDEKQGTAVFKEARDRLRVDVPQNGEPLRAPR